MFCLSCTLKTPFCPIFPSYYFIYLFFLSAYVPMYLCHMYFFIFFISIFHAFLLSFCTFHSICLIESIIVQCCVNLIFIPSFFVVSFHYDTLFCNNSRPSRWSLLKFHTIIMYYSIYAEWPRFE